MPNLTGKPRVTHLDTEPTPEGIVMFISTFKAPLVSAAVVAGLLTAATPGSAQADGAALPARAAAEQGSLRLITYNGQANFCGIDVSADHIEAYRVVINNNDPDTMAIARGSRNIASTAYQHNQSDLAHG